MPTFQLLAGFTTWGTIGTYEKPEDAIPGLAPSGYHVLEAEITSWLKDDFVDLVRSSRLLPVVQCFPLTVKDVIPALIRAKEIGALVVNAHAGTAHLAEDEAVKLVNALYDEAEKLGVRLLLETHRGRLTQDLFRTARLCDRIPRLRFNLDVSHLVVCEETFGPAQSLKPLIFPIIDRTEMIHGRICNGEQIQVDAGDGKGELAQLYITFWSEVMRRWRRRSPAGSAFIFTPELGPPSYSITGRDGKEFTDRISQSAVLVEMAKTAWKMSAQSSDPLW